jgi:apolipoprotein N-acyltransferase
VILVILAKNHFSYIMLKYKMIILKTFFIALLFSSSIYLEYFNINATFLNTFFGLFSIYFLLTISKKELFYTGFFIGILWFWWIAVSLQYYDLIYLVPFIIIGIGLIYGVLFYLTGLFKHISYRVIALFLISFINPFEFNWLKLHILFINSYFSILDFHLFIIIATIGLFVYYKKPIVLLLLIFSLNLSNDSKLKLPNLKIYQPIYNINQNLKWKENYQLELIKQNIKNIDYAIENNYQLIILPETIFALPLNKYPALMNILKEKSKSISIVTGALELDNNHVYNSTYIFKNYTMQIARKVVLVPFGEKVPLPQILTDLINKLFFNGASDYSTASNTTTFDINGTKFRNAICYEATTNEIFSNMDTKFMIAISNNAWFTPSIEPTLQYLLLKYYAKKYNVIIFHSSNKSSNMIIK